MSTYLQLCTRLVQEAGISGASLANVTGQTGEMLRVVNWIATAYEEIQALHEDWQFLRADFTFPTIASTVAYLPSAISLPEHAVWIDDGMKIYTNSVADEQRLKFFPWPDFRDIYQYGTVSSGRPQVASVKPDKSLALWPTPDAVYTVRGEYYKRPQEMTANGDEPLFPKRFHLAIVWRALMLYGAYESAPELFAHGAANYGALLNELENDQLPAIELASGLV